MPSDAHQVLEQGLDEVSDLLRADPAPRGHLSPDPALTRAVTRACVVLLCSHFERYLRSVNEEAIALVNESEVEGGALPERLRLQHSRVAVRELTDQQWTHRAQGLRVFAQGDAWLWSQAAKGPLNHRRIMQWMKSPTPKEVRRYYQLWGIDRVFERITRKTSTKRQLWLKMTELVDKRNNIAHGDLATEATAKDVRSYRETVGRFSDRVDRLLARILRVSLGIDCDWY